MARLERQAMRTLPWPDSGPARPGARRASGHHHAPPIGRVGVEQQYIAAGWTSAICSCSSSTSCPPACGRGTVMSESQPPRVSDDSPIGPDVDLERDDIRLADGTRLTPDIAASIAEDVRRAAGRP